MILDLPTSWLRCQGFLKFCLYATNDLGIFLSEKQLGGTETVGDNAHFQFEGTVIQRGPPISSAKVKSEAL